VVLSFTRYQPHGSWHEIEVLKLFQVSNRGLPLVLSHLDASLDILKLDEIAIYSRQAHSVVIHIIIAVVFIFILRDIGNGLKLIGCSSYEASHSLAVHEILTPKVPCVTTLGVYFPQMSRSHIELLRLAPSLGERHLLFQTLAERLRNIGMHLCPEHFNPAHLFKLGFRGSWRLNLKLRQGRNCSRTKNSVDCGFKVVLVSV